MDESLLCDLFAAIGDIEIRRMFGGQGIYSDDVMVAVVVGGELMLKADPETAPAFEAAGFTRWTYPRGERVVRMPFFRVPDEAYDDATILAEWTPRALAAARRSAAARPRKAGARLRQVSKGTARRSKSAPDA